MKEIFQIIITTIIDLVKKDDLPAKERISQARSRIVRTWYKRSLRKSIRNLRKEFKDDEKGFQEELMKLLEDETHGHHPKKTR